MEEKWKDTKYPNYEVSNLGRVRNKDTKQILRKTFNIVVINGRFRNVAVMVLESFFGINMKNKEIYYKNDNEMDCRLGNLSLVPVKRKKPRQKPKPIVKLTREWKYVATYPSISSTNMREVNLIKAIKNWKNDVIYKGYRWMQLSEYVENVMNQYKVMNQDDVRGKSVVQLSLDGDYLNTYKSGYYAAQALGNPKLNSGIIKCCRGYRKTAGGFIWKFKDDYMNEGN